MNIYRKVICYLLSGAMVFILAACEKSDLSSNEQSFSDNTASHREEYVEEKEVFEDIDGKFDFETLAWDGPEGYSIVISKDNAILQKSAELLQEYFIEKYNVEIKIVYDKTEQVEKEILIGKTNRLESNNNLNENEIEVIFKNKKLIFSAGHEVIVNSAVNKFVRLDLEKGKIATFKLKTDFSSTVLNEYTYVWGDEFEGNDIDFTKWTFDKGAMAATKTIETSYDKDVVRVEDGRLKLHAIRTFNPYREGTQFKVNYVVSSRETMNWLYGYMEIRAKVPFFKGAWPGFWACSTDKLSGIKHESIVGEIDMFEVFGNSNTLYSNLHKHGKDGSEQINNFGDWREKSAYKFEKAKNLSNEYHTYGIQWTPDSISIFVDGEKFVTYDLKKSFGNNSDMSVFRKPFDIMFSNFLMTDDTEIQTTLIRDSLDKLPSAFYIDYVRLYQKPGEGKIWTAESTQTYPDRK